MRVIYNPKEANCPIKTIFEGAIYEIGVGEKVSFDEEQYPLADFLLATYGFLKEEKLTPPDIKKGEFSCRYCGQECKSKIGLISHEKSCSKKTKISPQEKVTPVAPKARFVSQQGLNRSQQENVDFVDMPQLRGSRVRRESLGGRVQDVVYDGDGVGWYGPGIEDDIGSDFRKTKSGHGNF